MYGVAVEYDAGSGRALAPQLRAACRVALSRQPGYRRRLALVGDGWRRAVDLFLFDTPDAARIALAGAAWRRLAAEHPACRDAGPALLVSECPYGGLVVLLRRQARPTRGGQAAWRDHLVNAEPGAVLW
jgi:hypothetical protein